MPLTRGRTSNAPARDHGSAAALPDPTMEGPRSSTARSPWLIHGPYLAAPSAVSSHGPIAAPVAVSWSKKKSGQVAPAAFKFGHDNATEFLGRSAYELAAPRPVLLVPGCGGGREREARPRCQQRPGLIAPDMIVIACSSRRDCGKIWGNRGFAKSGNQEMPQVLAGVDKDDPGDGLKAAGRLTSPPLLHLLRISPPILSPFPFPVSVPFPSLPYMAFPSHGSGSI